MKSFNFQITVIHAIKLILLHAHFMHFALVSPERVQFANCNLISLFNCISLKQWIFLKGRFSSLAPHKNGMISYPAVRRVTFLCILGLPVLTAACVCFFIHLTFSIDQVHLYIAVCSALSVCKINLTLYFFFCCCCWFSKIPLESRSSSSVLHHHNNIIMSIRLSRHHHPGISWILKCT